jgi:choline dehydrogenase-like flavoprotein
LCGLGSLDYSYDAWREASGQGPSPFHGTYVTPEIRQKASMDVAGLKRELIASPRVTVCLNANVVELVTDADGRQVTRVEFCDPTGRRLAVRARLVVLAAGGIENPRLLLASARVQKTGVGNTHDLVGRFFMEHVDIEAGVFRPVTRDLFRQQLAWKRAGSIYVRNSLAISEQIRRDEQLLRCFFHIGDLTVDHTWAYRSAAHIVEQLRRGRPVYNFRYHLQNLIWERVPLLAAAKWRLHLTREIPGASGRPGLLPLRLTVEPSPSFASRVTLARERDPFGVPRVALDWRINDDDTAHATRSIELFAADMQALGLGEVLAEPPSRWARRGTYHHMGTTRMSDDPTRGVVDANCRVHGVGNLFVAGSSVFPTAGTGTPTLMLVALASRLAEHLGPQVARAPMPGGSWAA